MSVTSRVGLPSQAANARSQRLCIERERYRRDRSVSEHPATTKVFEIDSLGAGAPVLYSLKNRSAGSAPEQVAEWLSRSLVGFRWHPSSSSNLTQEFVMRTGCLTPIEKWHFVCRRAPTACPQFVKSSVDRQVKSPASASPEFPIFRQQSRLVGRTEAMVDIHDCEGRIRRAR